MRIIKTCLIDGKELPLQSENLLLELNAAGRGFVTVKTKEKCKGKSVIFDMGEYDSYYRWFVGFVEKEQSAENGYKRLFVRENSAKLEKPLSCSLRHPTLDDVCEWLEKQTGIEFKTPTADYCTTQIPLFTHAGNGFQLLENAGRAFNVPHFIWQQSPDGSIYVGSWQHSRWAEESRQIEIDSKTTLTQGSHSLSIPINARIRPGFSVNGKRIQKVTVRGDSYELEWHDLDDQGKKAEKSSQRKAMESEFPELAGGYHLARYAKIVAVADPSQGGEISDPFRPKYAVDIQLLDENNQEDKSVPVFPAVPLPVTSTASQGGDFAFPEIGTIVEVGFINGRSDKPVIRNFYPQGKTIPKVAPGELLRQQRPEVFERTDQAGNMHKETDQTISEKSFKRKIKTDSETKNVGRSHKNVDSNETKTIGGNKQTHVLGNVEIVTASDKSVGVGGNLTERVKGVASLISQSKAEIIAPKSYVGSEGQNIFRILESLIQIVADLANDLANHTHRGSPPPDNKDNIQNRSQQATGEKNKLTPIIV